MQGASLRLNPIGHLRMQNELDYPKQKNPKSNMKIMSAH